LQKEKQMIAANSATISQNDDLELSRRVVQYLLIKRPEFQAIQVEAEGGEVRLIGEVCSFYLRQLAIASTQRVAGVLSIVDLIDVPEPRRCTARTGACTTSVPQTRILP
jgi:osmotically-inducible protein OsmY